MSLSDIAKDILGRKMSKSDLELLDDLRLKLKNGEITLEECRKIWSREVTPI